MNNSYKRKSDGFLVIVREEKNGHVTFIPNGGGFEQKMDSVQFKAEFVRYVEQQQFKQALLTIPQSDKQFQGFIDGQMWNGWFIPYFTLEVSQQIAAEIPNMRFDEKTDSFVLEETGVPEFEKDFFEGRVIKVSGTLVKAYPIGAGYFCWEVVAPN